MRRILLPLFVVAVGLLVAPALSAPALDLYAAPESAGRGTGLSPSDPAQLQDSKLWSHVRRQLSRQPVTVHLQQGAYRITTPTLRLTGLGSDRHPLRIEGTGTSGAIIRLHPGAQARRVSLLTFDASRNFSVRNLHFTGPEELGYALRLIHCRDVLVEQCSWTDMTGTYYGATGASHEQTRNITWRNCTFRRIGSGPHAHMIYNAYGPRQLQVEDSLFEDCSGDYVRFRDETDSCTVARCTFRATGKFRSLGYPFISVPLFNDDDPENLTRTPNYEYFGTEFDIVGNRFEYPEAPTKGKRVALYFQHDGFDPPGRRHLLTAAEGALLENGSPEARRRLLLDHCAIDPSRVRMRQNVYSHVDHRVAFTSAPNYGARSKGWSGLADLSSLCGAD